MDQLESKIIQIPREYLNRRNSSRFFLRNEVLAQIRAAAQKENGSAVGLLFGRRERKEEGTFVEIAAFVPIEKILPEGNPTVFTEEEFLAAFNMSGISFTSMLLVGWYAIHGSGASASAREITTHRTFFKHPLQMLIVADTAREDVAGYLFQAGIMRRQEILLASVPQKTEMGAGGAEMVRALEISEQESAAAKKQALEAEELANAKERELMEERREKTRLQEKIELLQNAGTPQIDNERIKARVERLLAETDEAARAEDKNIAAGALENGGSNPSEEEPVELSEKPALDDEYIAVLEEEISTEFKKIGEDVVASEEEQVEVLQELESEPVCAAAPESNPHRFDMLMRPSKTHYRKAVLVAIPILFIIAVVIIAGLLVKGNSQLRDEAAASNEKNQAAAAEDPLADPQINNNANPVADETGVGASAAPATPLVLPGPVMNESRKTRPVTDNPPIANANKAPAASSDPLDDAVKPAAGGQAAGGTYYTVEKGDSLWVISKRIYGQGAKWKVIADANSLNEKSRLKVGMKLYIPSDK
jgi:LysM repeat protein